MSGNRVGELVLTNFEANVGEGIISCVFHFECIVRPALDLTLIRNFVHQFRLEESRSILTNVGFECDERDVIT